MLGRNRSGNADFCGLSEGFWTLLKTLGGPAALGVPSSAEASRFLIEVRDFEEEKSLVEHRRRLDGCGFAGWLWQHLIFCRSRPSPQWIEESRCDRNPEPQ